MEAGERPGGRAWTTGGRFRANWGPHVIYDDGPLWAWLARRGLGEPAGRVPRLPEIVFRLGGTRRRIPLPSLVRGLLKVRRSTAPVEDSFAEWASQVVGEEDARRIANFAGVVTFDHDPGRLSAAFVAECVRRATAFPPAARYIPGGWATLADRLTAHARRLGVDIRTGTHVGILPNPPVILAVPLAEARRLTGDDSLRGSGTRTAILDVGLAGRHKPPFVVSDLDASGWVETFSIPDPSLAPAGHHLVQAQAGMRPGESLDDAVTRIEALMDIGMPGWRGRGVWRRRARVEHQSGALDLPGTTWRDRPAIDRGGGVFLAGDMVAAPGLLAEVSHSSGIEAVRQLAMRSAPVAYECAGLPPSPSISRTSSST